MKTLPWFFLAVPLTFGQPPTFVERNGIVSIEAEHHTDNVGAWFEVEGRNAHEAQTGTSPDYRLVARKHPLSAGVVGEVAMPRNTWVPWGFPGKEAMIAVTLGHNDRKAAVFAYEKGAVLANGGRAVARRAFAPVPQATAPELARFTIAALKWAGKGLKDAILVTNAAALSGSEEAVAQVVKQAGFALKTVPADTLTEAAGALIVVPEHVRYEKIHGKLAKTEAPVVLAGKRELATELGLTLPPVLTPDGGNAMMIDSGKWTDHLRYAIHFAQPGDYDVWLLGQSGGTAGSDEAKIFFNRQPDSKADDFFEMKLNHDLGWVGKATARRPDNRKTPVPARINVPAKGWYNFYVVRGSEPDHHTPEPPREFRYPNWRIDKIVLAKAGSPAPSGDGPAETRNDGALKAPAECLTSSEFRPRQIWRVANEPVIIEAESLDHNELWVERQTPSGFTGRSLLEWRGPQWSRSIEGLGGNNDELHIRQGPPEGWLILRFQVETPGTYRLDVRNHHLKEDGDNDTWVAWMGQRATRQKPIVRLGDGHKDGTGFTWLDWGVPRFEFKPGLNEVYLGGRSVGFGVDRIVLYRDGDETAKSRALETDTPATQPLTVR